MVDDDTFAAHARELQEQLDNLRAELLASMTAFFGLPPARFVLWLTESAGKIVGRVERLWKRCTNRPGRS